MIKNISEKLFESDPSVLLAVTRTRLSAERTLMSWIRTSFSMTTFGFAIMKFFQYLASQSTVNPFRATGATQLGIFLILLGILSLIPGMIEHRKTFTELSQYDGKSRWSYAFIIGILVGLIGIYALSRAAAIMLIY